VTHDQCDVDPGFTAPQEDCNSHPRTTGRLDTPATSSAVLPIRFAGMNLQGPLLNPPHPARGVISLSM